MTIRQKRYAEAVYRTGKKRESAIIAGYAPGSAHSAAYKANQVESVQSYIDALIQADMGSMVQVVTLSQIAKDPDTSASSRIKAIDLLAKLSGHYSRLKVGESVAKDHYRELARRLIDKPAQQESRRKPKRIKQSMQAITEYVGIMPVERDTASQCDDTGDAEEVYVDG